MTALVWWPTDAAAAWPISSTGQPNWVGNSAPEPHPKAARRLPGEYPWTTETGDSATGDDIRVQGQVAVEVGRAPCGQPKCVEMTQLIGVSHQPNHAGQHHAPPRARCHADVVDLERDHIARSVHCQSRAAPRSNHHISPDQREVH